MKASYFTEDEKNYASPNENEFNFSDDEGDDIIGGGMNLNDYIKIAMRARFSFTEVSFICPCHQINEYYFQMHGIPQPENWCNKKHFQT